MGYYITRQARIDASHIVEITYDKLTINRDILQPKYSGESGLYVDPTYLDPTTAAETAILIRGLWQRDEPHNNITMALGSAAGYRPMDAGELREWAADQIRCMPRCAWCDEIIYTDGIRYMPRGEPQASLFCSMGCIMEYEDDEAARDATRAADRELDNAEQVTSRDIDFQSENRQNV